MYLTYRVSHKSVSTSSFSAIFSDKTHSTLCKLGLRLGKNQEMLWDFHKNFEKLKLTYGTPCITWGGAVTGMLVASPGHRTRWAGRAPGTGGRAPPPGWRRAACRRTGVERWRSGSGGETISTYQEEHSLLVALPRQLLQTALPHELAAGGDQVVVAHQVALQLHQLHEVLLQCQVVESFCRRR